jgi:hypothetical protein
MSFSAMVILKITSVLTTNLALLHAGGWDEILFVAVDLLMAWAIITWTGRSRDDPDDAEEEDDEALDDTPADVQPSMELERESARRPTERRDSE